MSRPDDFAAAGHRPLYARLLRLKTLTPSGFLCFVFLEGAVALGILLALAELVSWWGVLVLPATVAIMVKLNDVIAGSLAPPVPLPAAPSAGLGAAARSAGQASLLRSGGMPREAVSLPVGGGRAEHEVPKSGVPARAVGEESTTRLPGMIDHGHGTPTKRPWVERAEAQQQWARQSATRRYE